MHKKVQWAISSVTSGSLLVAGIAIAATHGVPRPVVLTTATTAGGFANLDACPTLAQGYHGGCVDQLQSELNSDQNAGLAVDGTFGPGTMQAVIAFQQANGIVPADGIVGPETKQALDRVSPSSAQPNPGDTAPQPPANLEECPTLTEGYHGGCINALQNQLNFDDNAGLTVDGTFGPTTQQAVIAFQQENDIFPADGIVGQQTKLALLNTDSVPTPHPGAPLTPFEICQEQGPGLISDGHGGCTHDGVVALGKSAPDCLNEAVTDKVNELITKGYTPAAAETAARAALEKLYYIYEVGSVFKCALLDNPDS